MSAANRSGPSWRPDPTSQRLMKWNKGLQFQVISESGACVTVTGILDSGSDHSILSSRNVKELKLPIIPFAPRERPTLEGFEDVLRCQPIGYVDVKIKQSDLALETETLSFLVVPSHRFDLILGSEFIHKHKLATKIDHRVENGIDPKDCNEKHKTSHLILALFDSRNKRDGQREEEETKQKNKVDARRTWQTIREIKEVQDNNSALSMTTSDSIRSLPTSFCSSRTGTSSGSSTSRNTTDTSISIATSHSETGSNFK